MAISAKDVAQLRRRTGLGMMDCKKALTETDGDFEAAVELLRKKVKGKMDERTDRQAAEGLIVAKTDGQAVAIVEVNAETDFVARNQQFIEAVNKIAERVLAGAEGEVPADESITAIIDDLRIAIQENISYRRGHKFATGRIGYYVHHNNKIGAMVQCEGEVDDELRVGLCQHICAAVPTPLAVDEAGLPADALEKERQRAVAEAEASGKPPEIAEKIATGKLRKWIEDHTLLGQVYVKELDSKKKVGQMLPAGSTVKAFVRYAIGQ